MLLTMAVYDTPENNRTWMTAKTLQSLYETVNFDRHRLIISDNGSCPETHNLYTQYQEIIEEVIFNGENIGTAKALNKAWRFRKSDEAVCKVDNDVIWHRRDWPDLIEMVFQKTTNIGICGLKRRDLDEWPLSKHEFYKTSLEAIEHVKGEPWLIVEPANHVIGTCQAYSPELLDKIGYLWQPGLYGFDDALACARARVAGFLCVFLHGISIDHIDPGGTEFITWKQKHAGQFMNEYRKALLQYAHGERDVYYDGGFEE